MKKYVVIKPWIEGNTFFEKGDLVKKQELNKHNINIEQYLENGFIREQNKGKNI